MKLIAPKFKQAFLEKIVVMVLNSWRKSLENQIEPDNFDPLLSKKIDAVISILHR
jgi:hypothetical protein